MKRNTVKFRHSRAGFSLMEVLIASAILIGSLVVLDQLSTLGRISANSAETMVTAQLLCEQKLNLMLSGMESIEPTEDTAWEDDENWHYAVDLEPLDNLPLNKLTVRVWQDEELFLQPQEYELVRWVNPAPAASSSEGEEASENNLSELSN
ncbi:MAG: prepilin-type N-terminal cleavage/methylation domain-containing protein [Planctomycetaceae bacterium]